MENPQKVSITITTYPSCPSANHISIKNQISTLRGDLHSHVHWTIIWMHKEIVRWWRVLFSLQGGGGCDICNNMYEPKIHYAKWNKLNGKRKQCIMQGKTSIIHRNRIKVTMDKKQKEWGDYRIKDTNF